MKKLVFIGLIALFFMGCNSLKVESTRNMDSAITPTVNITAHVIPPTATIVPLYSKASTYTEIPMSVKTSTLFSTATVTTTSTSTQVLKLTATPTLKAKTATQTPTFWAKCPKEDVKLIPDFTKVLSADFPRVEEPILEFLNQGGTRRAIIDALKTDDLAYNSQHYLERDITGDSIPELIIGYGPLYVFGCNQGMYQTMLAIPTDRGNLNDADPWIETIRDLNADGIPEIVITSVFAPFTWVRIYEWNDGQFHNLIEEDLTVSFSEDSVASLMDATVSFKSVGDGTFELILEGGIPGHMALYSDGYPWRKETNAYKWDGVGFAFYRQEYEPPEFRFQAVQDGDRASLLGEYDVALAFYQDAIFSDKLDWWSQERKEYEFACYGAGSSDCPTPPVPTPDPRERIDISGYARFRIMLLHIVRGYLPEAQIVYETLQSKYPRGQAGSAYTEMATAFLNEYQASNNIEKACGAAIEYATIHPVDVLSYLGNGDYAIANYGDQSFTYHPEDVCPFK